MHSGICWLNSSCRQSSGLTEDQSKLTMLGCELFNYLLENKKEKAAKQSLILLLERYIDCTKETRMSDNDGQLFPHLNSKRVA